MGEIVAAKGEQGCKIPRIVKKSIVTATAKGQILEIHSGREENARQLASMHWEFVTGPHPYEGNLDLPRQIAYLELIVARISTNVDCDE